MGGTDRTLQLRVTLKNIKPAIWRRVLVPSDLTFDKLHLVLQAVMGWQNYHLHLFTIHGQKLGIPDPDDHVPLVDERKHRAGALVHKGTTFECEYDFGDGWEHEIVVEAVHEGGTADAAPSCTAGARACPPEDCGGPHRYADLLHALAHPRSRRNRELREWIGGVFDAERFDLADVNAHLRKAFRRRGARRPKAGTTKKRTSRAKPTIH
jgi:hypothetical protein